MINMSKHEQIKDLKASESCDTFIRYCKIRDLSKYTYENYNRVIDRFLDFTGDLNLSQISNETIYKWIEELQGEDIANGAINTYARFIKVWLNFCVEEGYLADRPSIPKLKETSDPIDAYTDQELNRLLKKPDMSKFEPYRNWVLVNFLLGTGARRRTVRNVKIIDLDFENRLIDLKVTKTRKAYKIPMSQTLAKILREYLSYREGSPEDYLFCTSQGKKLKNGTLYVAIRDYNKKRGVSKTSIHTFRHTFAKKCVQAGMDPIRLQKLLGHSSLEMTKKYVNLFAEDLHQDYNQYNPLETLNRS